MYKILSKTPSECFNRLKEESNSILIDVRTRAEWGMDGVADLKEIDRDVIFLEWIKSPFIGIDKRFFDLFSKNVDIDKPSSYYFICAAGVRSLEAATHIDNILRKMEMNSKCFNVSFGFEGSVEGWKAIGLPWKRI